MSEENQNETENLDILFRHAIDKRNQPSTYTNGIRVSSSDFEFTLDFFEIMPNPETNNESAISYLQTRVTMNVPTAQKLTNILLEALKRWEENAGSQIGTSPDKLSKGE